MKVELTWSLVKSVLRYDANTGHLYWRTARKGVSSISDPIGHVNRYGYRQTSVFKHRVQVHRLVWFYVHGEWPTKQIDHIDRDKLNNKIENLRDVSARENSLNKNNASVHPGTHFCNRDKLWYAQIWVQGRKHGLGQYPTQAEAGEAYQKAISSGVDQFKNRPKRNSKTQVKGVVQIRPGVYRVRVKGKHIGYYRDLEEAGRVWKRLVEKKSLDEMIKEALQLH